MSIFVPKKVQLVVQVEEPALLEILAVAAGVPPLVQEIPHPCHHRKVFQAAQLPAAVVD